MYHEYGHSSAEEHLPSPVLLLGMNFQSLLKQSKTLQVLSGTRKHVHSESPTVAFVLILLSYFYLNISRIIRVQVRRALYKLVVTIAIDITIAIEYRKQNQVIVQIESVFDTVK